MKVEILKNEGIKIEASKIKVDWINFFQNKKKVDLKG
jgi:hypothetical protein